MGGGGKEMVTTTMRSAVIRVRAGMTMTMGVGGCKGEVSNRPQGQYMTMETDGGGDGVNGGVIKALCAISEWGLGSE